MLSCVDHIVLLPIISRQIQSGDVICFTQSAHQVIDSRHWISIKTVRLSSISCSRHTIVGYHPCSSLVLWEKPTRLLNDATMLHLFKLFS